MMMKNYNKHECKSLPSKGIYIDSSGNKNKTWFLIIQREAMEEDLEENHYLEEVGEIIWRTELEITHCPYCGEKLLELNKTEIAKYGNFRHIDSTGWSSKVS